jgi:hypothetical protein
LIHFPFTKFPALVPPKVSKGYAEFFTEKIGMTFVVFWRYECRKFAEMELNQNFDKMSATHMMYLQHSHIHKFTVAGAGASKRRCMCNCSQRQVQARAGVGANKQAN